MRGGAMTQEQAIERADRAFERLDVNSDDQLDQADREARERAMFAHLDQDGDGAVTFAEFQQARAERREHRQEARAERRHRPRAGLLRLGAMLREADINDDRMVSREDFRATALARFQETDADGDGTLTREERAAARRMARAQRTG